VLALTTEKRLLEYRVINAHRTLAHGLGLALIEARSLKGLLAFPGKVRRLRMKQRAKRRERVPNSFTDDVAAILRLVDPAFARAAADGVDAAIDWVKMQKAEPGAKARALAELAHWSLAADPAKAGRIGEDAASINPGEQRLFALAVRLREKGLVLAPASLCAAIRDHQPLSLPQSRLCDLMAEDAATLEHSRWGDALENGTGRTGEANLAIVCPPRWMALPRVLIAQRDASAAGLSVSIVTPADQVDFRDFAAVHIFANSITMACSVATDARASGCRVILDLANPPASMLTLKGSELEAVDIARLKGLGINAGALIVRSRSLAMHLASLNIDHIIASDAIDVAGDLDDEMITATLMEYDAKPGLVTIGCFGSLDGDPGLASCLDVFGALIETGDAEQVLIFGRGSHSAKLADRAEALGIADQVHFVGIPPPQRWQALLGALHLAVFPRIDDEALGSEIPMLFVQALVQNRPVSASGAVWNAQATFSVEAEDILTGPGDQVAQVRKALQRGAGRVQGASVDDSLATLYKALAQPL